MSQHTRRSRALIALGLAAAVSLAACGSDDETPAASGDPTESEEETTTTEAPAEDDEAEGETLEVTGVEYAFEGLDAEVEAGTELTFTNGGKEVHELILMRINDDETRSVEELLQLPEEEAMQSVTMMGVSVAAPGEDGEIMEGDLTVADAGRYAAICFIPVGTTEMPEGPPAEGEGGPPHFTQGMVQEFTVQ
jgi:plastocyanin